MNDLFQIRMTTNMGRGIFALKDIETQKNILDIDYRTYITYGLVAQHFFFGLLTEQEEVNDKKAHFAFYMAFAEKYKKHQKIHSQFILKYISKLPPFLHSLILWNEDELSALKDQELMEKARIKRQDLKEKFIKMQDFLVHNEEESFIPNYQSDGYKIQDKNDLSESESQCKKIDNQGLMNSTSESEEPNEDQSASSDETQSLLEFNEYKILSANVTFEKFLHFYSAIQSRNIYHISSWDPKSEIGALISVLELLNHSPSGQIEKKLYHLEATTKIQKDEQIFINYGQYNNSELFFIYGCVIDGFFEETKNDYVEGWVANNECKSKKYAISQQEITEQRISLAQRYNKVYEKENKPLEEEQKIPTQSEEST